MFVHSQGHVVSSACVVKYTIGVDRQVYITCQPVKEEDSKTDIHPVYQTLFIQIAIIYQQGDVSKLGESKKVRARNIQPGV